MNKTAKLLLAAAFAVSGLTAQAETLAEIDTNYGTIKLSLDEQRAPKTVANFVRYAEKGFYNNTVFHRVIDGFMIQGGGFTADLAQKSTDKAISNEAGNGLKNTAGTIAMARTGNPHSATSQFFINLADNDFLNHKDHRRKATAMPYSAKSSAVWTLFAISAKFPLPIRPFIKMFRSNPSSSAVSIF